MLLLAPLSLVTPALAPQDPAPAEPPAFEEVWSTPLGSGFSRPVVDGERVLVTFREPREGGGTAEDTTLWCGDLATGAERWRAPFPDLAREGQEDYGGGRGPHADPLVHRGVALALGYGGRLAAYDAASGQVRWTLDLVEERAAPPVQFGFAASPLAAGEHVIVLAGGEQGAVLALDPATGGVRWSACDGEVSYVTPILADLAGMEQLVCVLRDELVGLNPEDGALLWSVPHKRPNLTNFAEVRAVPPNGVLVSGQGNRGLRRIDLARDGASWSATEAWWSRGIEFSHGALLALGEQLFGCNTGGRLCCANTRTGEQYFKLPDYGELALVPYGPRTLCLREDGRLSLLDVSVDALFTYAEQQVLEAKAWTAPVPLADGALLRDARRLVRLRIPLDPTAEPTSTVLTGADLAEAQVSPAVLALAEGLYRLEGGKEIELEAVGAGLLVHLGDSSAQTQARSEDRFEVEALQASFELQYGDGPRPTGLLWTDDAGAQRATFVQPEPVTWTGAQRARFAGTWNIAEEVQVTFTEEQDELWATSTPYGSVRFRCTPEGESRLWLDAEDAPYGIPRALVVIGAAGKQLTIHQDGDTYVARRP